MKKILTLTLLLGLALGAKAQAELYPKHFSLEQVTLLDGPMKTAMELNFQMLMQYDVDRLLTPFVRQSGLAATTDTKSPYYQWLTKHPNFGNWGGDAGFDLSGHVGGHYLTALALAWAACRETGMKARLKERMEYMLAVMKDCQDQYDQNTEGLYGFIGGQPINESWKQMYQGSTEAIGKNWGWVPFYCQHKILAGLRDAYIYGGSDSAKEMFRKMADWSVNLIGRVSDTDLQGFLNCEHGGMNESLLDAYQLFGDEKYLTAAKRFTHKTMLDGMQTLNTTFLDNRHANTQVPKYIGMERIGEIQQSVLDGSPVETNKYLTAAQNFWTDVAQNRTVCIGGNSVAEHFLTVASSNRYIDHLDGPESCNTNNMLKLSEMMSDRTGDAQYADFYEQAMWNHILSTQDPTTGGYVYFTTLRPQAYRIYSQVNQGMWCCVGTGMENHSKYGHFIYTHDGKDVLYVNLFTPSRLASDDFIITQETMFPAVDPTASNIPTPQTATTTLTVGKAGTYTIAVRHPAWAGKEFSIAVNGTVLNGLPVEAGKANYVSIHRTWAEGDKIVVWLPMEVRYEVCPNYTDYIAFKFGPILLAANVSAEGETLPNEYAGAGRMDHAPGSRASSKNLLSAPLLIGERADVLKRIQPLDLSKLTFTIDASREGVETYKWKTLTLQPFHQIHHARYSCYWYQQTAENFANSSMAQTEAANEALQARTLDFVAPGEQQSEAGHDYNYSSDSSKGNYNGENYRDARAGGYVQYTLFNPDGEDDALSVLCRFTTADQGRKASLLVDGEKIANITIPSSVRNSENGFYNIEYPIPAALVKDAQGQVKRQFVVRLAATEGTMNPGLYYLRLMKGYVENANAYQFRAQDWTTGDQNRIPATNITYDTERNVIKAKSTGANNIALMMKYQNLDYDIDKSQIYLVVRGTGLSTTSTASYLWWLNGKNRGSQVAPTTRKSITVDGEKQTLIAWDMTQSGLYDNFTGDRPSVCVGQTIFGLTSTKSDGSCEIHDINFIANVDEYISEATRIASVYTPAANGTVYTLQGIRSRNPQKGVFIQNGRKYIRE
ncbi:MAG: glycoside hydrolase family 127 protein [Bacteroidaceae bacterium]|nr:glycoside hydrolase family 127 protein [Bacteroidaceae bacterium]